MRPPFSSILLPGLLALLASTGTQAQLLLDPLAQPKFVNSLPIPTVMDARAGGKMTISITQFNQSLGLVDKDNKPLTTKVWGYNGTYPGPTILAQKDVALQVTWENNLTSNGKPLPHLLPIDVSVDWAFNNEKDWEQWGVPVVTHLHGGHSESASDGLPDAWYTPDFKKTGKGFKKQTLRYDNDQEAATLWYHDHTIGITRLNVYAGLAGYYILTDGNEKKLQEENKIPSGAYDIGLVIQDRMFTEDGQLYYPSLPPSLGAPEPSISPEFFGDFILVNGKTWPVLEVEPRPYRFRLLNGSDSRFYNLFLTSGPAFTQIGSDGGFLPAPVSFPHLLIGTGERKDVVVDFSNFSGQTLILKNNAKTPYPKGGTVNPQTTGQVMAFKVTKPLDNTIAKAVLPVTFRAQAITPLQTTLQPRQLILFESTDEYGRLKPMLGTIDKGVLNFHDPVTENPMLNSTEEWEVYNLTEDAHTIHLHLVQMQLISRQKFHAAADMDDGKPSNIRLAGRPKPPGPDEAGWKDTYIMLPGEVTRVIATFDRPGRYAWHCHILSHEDHEMMRPFMVGDMNDDNDHDLEMKTRATDLENKLALQTLPNPFNSNLLLQINLPQKSNVQINVYNAAGSRVQQVYSGSKDAGPQQFTINGANWSNGTYFCEVIVNNERLLCKLVLQQ